MIRPLVAKIDCPSTDKGSIKRAQVYRNFSSEIDSAYEDVENRQDGQLELDAPRIEDFTMTTFHDRFNIHLPSLETSFFAAGIASLEAIQMRGIIQKTMNVRSHKLYTMVVYNCGNAAKVAQYLHKTCASYLSQKKLDYLYAMTTIGTRARLWQHVWPEHYLTPLFGSGDGSGDLSDKEEYIKSHSTEA